MKDVGCTMRINIFPDERERETERQRAGETERQRSFSKMALVRTFSVLARRGRATGSQAAARFPLAQARLSTEAAGIPKVSDDIVNFTIVDEVSGEHHKLSGLVGQNLVQVCRAYGVNETLVDDDSSFSGHISETYMLHHKLEDGSEWHENAWGEGVQSGLSHVYMKQEVYEKLPAPDAQEVAMLQYDVPAEELRDTSRLGVMITLTKDLEGEVFYAPDQWPSAVP